ncbi:hypothetical protein [Spirosoma areae]
MSSQEKIMGAGKALYMLNVPNVEIARTLDVSETTVSNWVTKGGWREERAAGMALKKNIQDSLLGLIDYQLEALNKIKDDNRRSGDLKLIDKGDVDALAKMFATIKGKELSFAMLATVIRELIEFLSQRSPDLAKMLVPYTNDFLLAKKEVLTA